MSTNIRTIRRSDLVYPELSYQILGVLFGVGTEVGFGHKEIFYQRACGNRFRKVGFEVKEQVPARIIHRGQFIGIYYFDFLINDKVVIEIKVRNYFSKKDIDQLYAYLKARNLKLGIIAHFTKSGVKYKRVVNVI